jgi:hypothetical protein
MLLFNAGSGKYIVTAKVHVLDSGLTVTLYGGEEGHVGSVVVAIPRPSLQDPAVTSSTSSVINIVVHLFWLKLQFGLLRQYSVRLLL